MGGRTDADGRSVDVGGGLESFFVRSAAVAAVATVDVVITLVRCSMEGERERTNTTAVGGEREREREDGRPIVCRTTAVHSES